VLFFFAGGVDNYIRGLFEWIISLRRFCFHKRKISLLFSKSFQLKDWKYRFSRGALYDKFEYIWRWLFSFRKRRIVFRRIFIFSSSQVGLSKLSFRRNRVHFIFGLRWKNVLSGCASGRLKRGRLVLGISLAFFWRWFELILLRNLRITAGTDLVVVKFLRIWINLKLVRFLKFWWWIITRTRIGKWKFYLGLK
jgi:hypothetical protein